MDTHSHALSVLSPFEETTKMMGRGKAMISNTMCMVFLLKHTLHINSNKRRTSSLFKAHDSVTMMMHWSLVGHEEAEEEDEEKGGGEGNEEDMWYSSL